MADPPDKNELHKKLEELEKGIAELNQSLGQRSAEVDELRERRTADNVLRRIHIEFAVFGVGLALFAALGFYGFGKYLQHSISMTISRSVNADAEKEIQKISEKNGRKY